MQLSIILPLFVGLNAVDPPASEAKSGAATVLVLRAAETGRSVETYAIVDGDAIAVPPAALRTLGIALPANDVRDLTPLSEIPGLTWSIDRGTGDATLKCAAHCYAMQPTGPALSPMPPLSRDVGAFLNVDAIAEANDGRKRIAAAFELVGFGPHGAAETSWSVGAARPGEVVRLESRWTIDAPDSRVRVRFGDSVTRPGATGTPARFAGVQIARDFSLDPRFVTRPTNGWIGFAETPSVIDLYVNGALRHRGEVEAGPFSIRDAPMVSGAGDVRIVVTDSLGRQTITSSPFYSSATLLRPGLTDFSVAAGFERERFAMDSAHYADAFASGVFRRGLSRWRTMEARGEVSAEHMLLGAGLSSIVSDFAQGDVALAFSRGETSEGSLVRLGLSRNASRINASAEAEAAEQGFTQVGSRQGPMRWRGALSFGASDPRYGAIALSAVRADYRAEEAVSILALDFTATAAAAFQWGLSFSHSRADRESLAVAFRLAFHTRSTSAASTASMSKGVVTVDAGIRSSPPPEGGLGWSLGGRSGDVEVAQAGVRLEGRSGVVDAAASRIDSRNAFRVQGIASIAWMDEGFYLSRLIQDSFVLADVGAPNVEIALSNRPAGRTGRDGKLLVAGARAYELNRISMQPNDLPDGVAVAEDSLQVMPSARAGTIARFPVARGRAGELRIVDVRAMPIPSGVLFIRRSDGGRFPVGRDGRVYLEGVRGTLRLQRMDGDGCVVDIAETDLEASLPVVCKVPAA